MEPEISFINTVLLKDNFRENKAPLGSSLARPKKNKWDVKDAVSLFYIQYIKYI